MIQSSIDALLIGRPTLFRADGTMSAIARKPVETPVMLREFGFDGDEVADSKVHGGAEKAVHSYPSEHYGYWNEYFVSQGSVPPGLLNTAGAFGENISSSGMTEKKVRIGDRFRLGNALVEVAQGRQPCWKIDHHLGHQGLSAAIIESGRCGLYFRVLEEGLVAPHDKIEQVEQASLKWTVEHVFRLLIGGGHKGESAKGDLVALSKLESLAKSWRIRATKLAGI